MLIIVILPENIQNFKLPDMSTMLLPDVVSYELTIKLCYPAADGLMNPLTVNNNTPVDDM
jgi:hypothetical protein